MTIPTGTTANRNKRAVRFTMVPPQGLAGPSEATLGTSRCKASCSLPSRGHITPPLPIESPDHEALHYARSERRGADGGGGAAGAARLRTARPTGSHRDAHRLRYEPVRRLHGPYRRPGGEELHRTRNAGGGARDHHHRRSERQRRGRGRGGPAPAAAGVLGEARAAVRVLHSRHDHDGDRPACSEAQADRGGDPPRARGKSVPLHGLPKHRRRDPGRGRRTVGGPAMATLFGSGIKRREDPRLITGKATYTDDVKLPGLLYAAVLRSTYAHAKLRKVDVAKAKQATGVVAVYTGADVKDKLNTVRCAWNVPNCDLKVPPHPPLAVDRVRYVGDGIAMVVAESRAAARDALDLIDVDYDALDAVVDPEKATQKGAPEVGGGFGSKIPGYPDEALVSFASMELGRPVKWTEDRSENYKVTIHGRDHVEYVALCGTKDGKITGLRTKVYAGLGGYASTAAPGIPTILHGLMYSGPYTIPNIEGTIRRVHDHHTGGRLPPRRPSR